MGLKYPNLNGRPHQRWSGTNRAKVTWGFKLPRLTKPDIRSGGQRAVAKDVAMPSDAKHQGGLKEQLQAMWRIRGASGDCGDPPNWRRDSCRFQEQHLGLQKKKNSEDTEQNRSNSWTLW